MTKPIPVFLPDLPHLSSLSDLFDEIHQARNYSNNGPLLKRFEAQFEERCGGPIQISAQANGTLAIQTAILSTAGFAQERHKICLLPSFTFSASVSAVLAAGYQPHFVDVDPATWMVDSKALKSHPKLHEAGLVVVTAAFGKLPDLAALVEFSEETKVPVVVDGAACADAFLSGHIGSTHGLPVALSFHATKPFGLGEGGAVIADNEDVVRTARSCTNFGFDTTRTSVVIGTNAKMSEMVAAVGLRLLEEWDERRERMMSIVKTYHQKFDNPDCFKMEREWVTTYPHIIAADDAHRLVIEKRLDNRNIGHRRWWGLGCHRQPAYAAFGCDSLPVTNDLAGRIIGLPFFAQMTLNEIETVRRTVHG